MPESVESKIEYYIALLQTRTQSKYLQKLNDIHAFYFIRNLGRGLVLKGS